MADNAIARSAGKPLAVRCSQIAGGGFKQRTPADDVCKLVRLQIETALGRHTIAIQGELPGDGQDWIDVMLRSGRPASVSATVHISFKRRHTALPNIAVDVADREIGHRDLAALARAVAQEVARIMARS